MLLRCRCALQLPKIPTTGSSLAEYEISLLGEEYYVLVCMPWTPQSVFAAPFLSFRLIWLLLLLRGLFVLSVCFFGTALLAWLQVFLSTQH